MAIDILNIEPNVVSKDIRGYSFLFYGGPKVGKTTLATRFPKHLLLGFEKGYNALPGISAAPINNWSEFLQVLGQLKAEKRKHEMAKAKGENYELKYETIIIDIADIAWTYCEKYILAREGVDRIKDVPYGQGWALVGKEYDEKMRSIVQMGYGLILISHAKFSTSEVDEDIKYATCSLENRPKSVCTRLVDVYGYISMEKTDEGIEHILHLRACPEWEAGSRFKYMPESIVLNYNNLVNAVGEAIDKEAEELGMPNLVVSEEIKNNYKVEEKPDFATLKSEVGAKMQEIMAKASEAKKTESTQAKIAAIVERYLGKGHKFSDSTESQIEQVIMINEELKEVVV